MKLAWFHRKRKPVELIRATVFDLDPGKKYVLALDAQWLTPDERQALSRILINKGIQNITCVAGRGNPAENMVVLEQRA